MKRIRQTYKQVSVVKVIDGFGIALDGKPVKTPSKRSLVVPKIALAKAIAEELEPHEEEVDVSHMPMFRLAATVIDRIGVSRDEVNAVTLKFGETDLLCYRAKKPPELLRLQAKLWDPLLDWARSELNASLLTTDGITPLAQPPQALTTLKEALNKLSDFELMGISGIAAITGSLIVGFALKHGRISPAEAADICLLDESFQMAVWGQDEAALLRQTAIRREIDESAALLSLLT